MLPPSPGPASPAGLPFDPVENPPATIGERLDVDIADDFEVYRAELVLRRRV
jgi:hypothetical protein